eukprot:TRINITY_DN47334_c0_g1_i1.p1 TRINITY_DN47334_c0_g1~~TRINITY_DN47334_c0_g1_i1.p1  ORF type:complete len:630 (+),score=169.13 TRINITY_DN47334_c0_g1_i1:46-1890(+)
MAALVIAAAALAAWPHHDIVVIGAGPGGLQVAHELQSTGADFVVLEQAAVPGSFYERYPRHRKLISINKKYTGVDDPEYKLRHDWNSLLGSSGATRFPDLTDKLWPHADTLLQYLRQFVEQHGLTHHIRYNTKVTDVRKVGDRFEIRTDGAEPALTADVVIVATGRSTPHVDRSLPGHELMVGYEDVDTSPEAYRNERVLIVGGGNSALETADALEANARYVHLLLRSKTKLAYQTHYVGDTRAVNARFLDRYLLKSEEVILVNARGGNFTLKKDHGGGIRVEFGVGDHRQNDTAARHPYDRVIRCMGFRPDLTIFSPSAMPAMDHGGAFPRLTTAFESANVSGLFFAGNLMHSRDYRRSSGGFIHGFRYLAKALPHVIALRLRQAPWPADSVDCDLEPLRQLLHQRVKTASGMYQMFGQFGDVFVLPGAGAVGPCSIAYHSDVPIELVTSGVVQFGAADMTYITLTMEWHPAFHGTGVLHHKRDDDTPQVGANLDQDRSSDVEFAALFGSPVDNPVRTWRPPSVPRKGSDEWLGAGKFLHPALRLWRRTRGRGPQAPELLASHHIREDVFTTFDEEVSHVQPLRDWLEYAVGPIVSEAGGNSTCGGDSDRFRL